MSRLGSLVAAAVKRHRRKAVTTFVMASMITGGAVHWWGGSSTIPSTGCAVGGTTFCDEFSSSSVDTSKWLVMNDHSDSTNSEVACYLTANTVEGSGVLSETVKAESHTCPGGTSPVSYTSGAFQMKPGVTITRPATIDVTAKFAGGQGPWPAIWMLGTDCQSPAWLVNGGDPPGCAWPANGSQEIDIAEVFASSARNTVNENLIDATGNVHDSATVSDLSTAFHTYTLVWGTSSLIFKIDGTTVNTIGRSPSTPMFLIVDTSIGGGNGTPITDATLPQQTVIDSVHIS